MKRVFSLTHAKIKPARLIDAARHEIKKYMKKERTKALPEGVDFWDFEVKFGKDEASAEVIHLKEINRYMEQAEKNGEASFYIEVLPKAGVRSYVPPVAELDEVEPYFNDDESN